ncbi:MAG: glycosyltransferase family 2 protein [Desulfosalsimonadaceae bacterium]
MINRKKANRFAVIIPVYNHGASVENVIAEALKLNLPVFVVDDGSTDDTHERIRRFTEIRILRHSQNEGKGAAIMTGFIEAARIADWGVTLDADGQHDPLDARGLIRAAEKSGSAVIVGRRTGMDGPHVQWTSRFGRKFSNFWVRVCGGPLVSDSQSGFRIYPLPEVLEWGVTARRFEFEVEVLVRAHWKGVPVLEVPVGVNYLPPRERISHFRPAADFFRNARTFTRLIVHRIFTKQPVSGNKD